MLAEIHPLPMREVMSVEYNLDAGGEAISDPYMIQGYSRIVGCLEEFNGGGAAATFTVFQGYRDIAGPGFFRFIHNTDVFNINNGDNIPFNYAVLLKGMMWYINNTSGAPADFRLSIWLRKE